MEAEIQKYEALVEDRQKYVELLKDIQDSDLERTAENDNKKREIKDLIHSLNVAQSKLMIRMWAEP